MAVLLLTAFAQLAIIWNDTLYYLDSGDDDVRRYANPIVAVVVEFQAFRFHLFSMSNTCCTCSSI